MNNIPFKRKLLATAVASASFLGNGSHVVAAEVARGSSTIDEVVVMGVRQSQIDAVNRKRYAKGIVDGISAEDLGKLPDVTVADTLQRIPGIQIQRNAGEGATVNVRGLPQVRTLLNGEQFLTAGNIGEAQPNLTDIPSQLIKGIDVYKSTDLNNKRSGLTGTIDLKTWRPLDFDEGVTVQVSGELAQGENTRKNDLNVNGLINWSNGTVGVMVGAVTSEANLGNNFAGISGDIFGSNDWGGNTAVERAWIAPHGFDSFNRVVERQRDAVNGALQIDFDNGFKLTAEGFYTEMEEFDRNVGLNISNRWQTLDFITPTVFTHTGVPKGDNSWVSVDEYDIDALWVNSFTVNRTTTSESKHFNLELEYEDENWSAKARYIKDSADNLSMNGQSQGDLSNWRDSNFFQLNPFYPADIAALYDPSRLLGAPGANGGRFIDPNPLGYGENPQLHLDISGSRSAWSGFDMPISGGLGVGATLRDYMANVDSYAVGAFSSEGNTENNADSDIFSVDGTYEFTEPAMGFVTEVSAGIRASSRDAEIAKFHLFSNFYAGNGASDPEGCAAQWKAIDVEMNNAQCTAGFGEGVLDASGNPVGYTVNRPTRIDEFNNVIFVSDFGGVTTGLPGVWAADPRDYDNVTAFHQNVFGGATRVSVPGESYDVSLDEISVFADSTFEFEELNLTGTLGLRYIDTELSVRQNTTSGEQLAYGDTQIDTGDFTSDNNYSDVLPALNLTYRPMEEWAIRFSASKNMMAQDLGEYGGGLVVSTASCTDPTIAGGRCVTGASETGNPQLDPWTSNNFDFSAEYYIGEASMLTAAVFLVEINGFTTAGVKKGSFPDSDGVIRREVDVSTNIQRDDGEIKGLEVGAKLAFSDITEGILENFGLDINYTHAPSDGNDQDPAGSNLPFPDNSKDQYNIVGWYQNDNLQGRVAYNWRSDRFVGKQGAGLPGFQDEIGYLDAQVTYMISEDISVYVNGSNITGEVEEYYIDFGDGPNQNWQQNEFEARYTLGVRAKFELTNFDKADAAD